MSKWCWLYSRTSLSRTRLSRTTRYSLLLVYWYCSLYFSFIDIVAFTPRLFTCYVNNCIWFTLAFVVIYCCFIRLANRTYRYIIKQSVVLSRCVWLLEEYSFCVSYYTLKLAVKAKIELQGLSELFNNSLVSTMVSSSWVRVRVTSKAPSKMSSSEIAPTEMSSSEWAPSSSVMTRSLIPPWFLILRGKLIATWGSSQTTTGGATKGKKKTA